MGTTDPKIRIFSGGIIQKITGTSNQSWSTAQKIGLVRPSDRGRELYCLEDAYRVALSEELRNLGLDARVLVDLVPGIVQLDWNGTSGVCLYDAGSLHLLVYPQAIAASVDEALVYLSVTLAAEPPEEVPG